MLTLRTNLNLNLNLPMAEAIAFSARSLRAWMLWIKLKLLPRRIVLVIKMSLQNMCGH